MATVRMTLCLSGTPAEAGVRACISGFVARPREVSVEPLPKQGCEADGPAAKKAPAKVSVEPLPKQGCEKAYREVWPPSGKVSVEPLPKQGCEVTKRVRRTFGPTSRLSGTPAEAGVRVVQIPLDQLVRPCLSGTPAEAGVRAV